jgi:ABC-2 type transport system permease protein
MQRYVNLFVAKCNYHLAYFYHFRFSGMVHFLTSLLWFFLGMAGISIILGNVQHIGGWTKEEIYILMLIFYVHVALIHALFYTSLSDITYKVLSGNLDSVLTKPVGTRFWLTIDKLVLPQVLRFIFTLILLVGYCISINFVPELIDLLYALILFILGVIHFYLFFFTLMLLSFWVTNVWNIPWLVDRITNGAEMPVGSVDRRLQFVLTYIAPMAFIAYFPALAFLGKASLAPLFTGIAIALVFYLISEYVWRISLKRYSSASS